jgi:periplasmic protein TonB
MRSIIIALTILFFSPDLFAQTIDSNEKDTTSEFTSVQIEAQFPGGLKAWKKYLEKNLNVALAQLVPLQKGEKTAMQTVIVSFKIDAAGNVSDVKADNQDQVLPALAKEAVRVIRTGPKWTPAQLNGKNVIYRQRQSITWVREA